MSRTIYRLCLVLCWLVPWYNGVCQQEATGFYIILDSKKECSNPFRSLVEGLPLCLSKAPIIAQSDFESVSNVCIDSVRSAKYINLKVSKEAYNKFLLMSRKLPRLKLALVVDGTIVGILDNLDAVGNPIPIYSNLYSTDVEWIYQRLRKVKMGEKL